MPKIIAFDQEAREAIRRGVSKLAKPMLFALLIALIATINGTAAGRDPLSVGEAATRTMIGAVAAILLADLVVILLVRG